MDFFEPRINPDTAAFWEGCRAHELCFQKCSKCGKVRWPASYLCPDCLSEAHELVRLSPEGKLYSYVIMRKPFHPSLADKIPYVVATVDLKDGVRILANILDWEPDKLRCGADVLIDWHDSETYSRPIARLKGDEV